MRLFQMCFLAALSLAQKPIGTCTKKTLKCPTTKEQWDKRYLEFPCFEEGTNYTCLQAEGGLLVEGCSYPDIIQGSTGRCPVLINCYKTIAVLGIEAIFTDCPEDVKGCPGKYHPEYTVNEMYKYPACIVTNWTELFSSITTTIPITSTTENNTANERREEIVTPVKIILPIILSFLFVTICSVAILLYVRRRRKARNNDVLQNDAEETQPLKTKADAGGVSKDTVKESQLLQTGAPVCKHQNEDFLYDELVTTLRKRYKGEMEQIPASPLQRTSRISMDKLYSPVSIREDLEYKSRGRNMGRGDIPEKRIKLVKGPQDLFLVDGEITKNIFMIGDAGYGKSVFCLRLLDYWGRKTDEAGTKKDDELWIKYLRNFQFLFFVRLRRTVTSKNSLLHMICNDFFLNETEFHSTISDVLRSKNHRCLVIIDGLDEVTLEEKLPFLTEGFANCSFFWTMRPWKLDEFSDLISMKDRVVEIHGLTEKGVEIITENILVHHLGIRKESVEYKAIVEKSKEPKMRSILQIPLMAMTCIELWYHEKYVGESRTSLYAALLDLLIKRAFKSNRITNEMENALRKTIRHGRIPKVLKENDSVESFNSVILKFGKIAYEDLVEGNTHLVFRKFDLKRVIGETEFIFGLETGLLSKCEAAGCGNVENVSVNFFHKSMQEFLAAIYIEMKENVSDSFCSATLTSVEKANELSNILIFLSGLNPCMGSKLSERILSITDQQLIEYRELRDLFQRSREVELLYESQANCYRECKDHHLGKDFRFHVPDINIRFKTNEQVIRDTTSILINHPHDIRSLWFEWIPDDKDKGVPSSVLGQCLKRCESLRTLCIKVQKDAKRTLINVPMTLSSLEALVLYNITFTSESFKSFKIALESNNCLKTLGLVNIKCQTTDVESNDEYVMVGEIIQLLPALRSLSTLYIQICKAEDKQPFLNVLDFSQIKSLRTLYFYGIDPPEDSFNSDVVKKLCTVTGLHTVGLSMINLGDNDEAMVLSPNMNSLELVTLYQVDVSLRGWEKFFESVLNIQHEFNVRIIHRSKVAHCFPLLRSHNYLEIVYEYEDDHYGDTCVIFKRKRQRDYDIS